MANGVKFTRESAARIADAVRRVERTPRDVRGRRLRMRPTGGGGTMPIGEFQFQVWSMVAQNEADWDDVRFCPP